jgi:hypothetical protein
MIVFYDRKAFIVQATGSTVAEHSNYDPKSKGSNPGTCMSPVACTINIL